MIRPGPVTPIPKETRPWVCRKEVETCTRKEPCPSCLGRRNRSSGLRKQREARKKAETILGVQAGRYASQTGNEENWRLSVRAEHKADRHAGTIVTFYRNCREQSDDAKAYGDPRPFVAMASQKGTRQTVWVIDEKDAVAFAEAVLGIK